MRKDEFEAAYCERSGITREYYREHFVSLPCACGEESCKGWAKVFLDEHMMLRHLASSLPNTEQLLKMEDDAIVAMAKDRGLEG